jgi:hypothetical protein
MPTCVSDTRTIESRSHLSHYERQAAFVLWYTQMFERAQMQGVLLESLTDFEREWTGRM